MNVAILGLGTMGRMFAASILANAGPGVTVRAANRAGENFDEFLSAYPDISLSTDFASTAKGADIIFLCVLPLASFDVLSKIRNSVSNNCVLVSIVSDLSLDTIGTVIPGKVMRIVPTITTKTGGGVTLMAKNDLISVGDVAAISSLFGDSLHFKIVLDSQINQLSGITSCGPGIIAKILNDFTEAFHTHQFPKDQIRELVLETVLACCNLSKQQNMSFREITAEVATKGGITEAAVSTLESPLPPLFNTMVETMHNKHKFRKEKVSRLLNKAAIRQTDARKVRDFAPSNRLKSRTASRPRKTRMCRFIVTSINKKID